MPSLDIEDAEALRRAYVDDGLSLSTMAEMAGCSYASVRRALLAHGVDIRRSGPAPIGDLRDKAWLEARVAEGRSATDIAALLGCAEGTVRSALLWAGLGNRLPRTRPAELDDPSFLRQAYEVERRSVRSIAEEIGCSKDLVLGALRSHGVAIRGRGRSSRDVVAPVSEERDELPARPEPPVVPDVAVEPAPAPPLVPGGVVESAGPAVTPAPGGGFGAEPAAAAAAADGGRVWAEPAAAAAGGVGAAAAVAAAAGGVGAAAAAGGGVGAERAAAGGGVGAERAAVDGGGVGAERAAAAGGVGAAAAVADGGGRVWAEPAVADGGGFAAEPAAADGVIESEPWPADGEIESPPEPWRAEVPGDVLGAERAAAAADGVTESEPWPADGEIESAPEPAAGAPGRGFGAEPAPGPAVAGGPDPGAVAEPGGESRGSRRWAGTGSAGLDREFDAAVTHHWAPPSPEQGPAPDGRSSGAGAPSVLIKVGGTESQANAPPLSPPSAGGPPPQAPSESVPLGRIDVEIDKIEAKTFSVVLRGYDREEVRAFLSAVAQDYRKVISSAKEAVNAARATATPAPAPAVETPPTPPPPAPAPARTFDDIGSRVTAVLTSAAEAAEEITSAAEKEALAIRQRAREESEQLRRSAADTLAEVERARAAHDKVAAELEAEAQSRAATIMVAAQQRAAQLEEDARHRASTMERTVRANIDAVIAEARRDYEHLRSAQQQCIDRLASVEFLARHARDGMSENAGQSIDELL